jgi:hypothetical protein
MDPFDVLGLRPDATADEVNDARRRLAIEHHPDRGGDPHRMREINGAADAALRRIAADGTPARDTGAPGPSSDAPSGQSARSGQHPPPGEQRHGAPGRTVDGSRVARDVPSFVVEALPAVTFEALVVVASWLGEVLDDDPPYRLETYLGQPFDCWCRLDVVPDAGASTVSLTVAGLDGAPAPDVVAVRDAWVADLNSIDWPS